MNTWAQVDRLENEEPVNEETLNRPIEQLASRTEYLKRRLTSINDAGYQSSLILYDVDLVKDEDREFNVGNIVYRKDDGFHLAQAKMHAYDDFKAADAAFSIGILVRAAGVKGDVLIYGKLDLSPSTWNMKKSDVLQTGEDFRPGRYYLSAVEPGKLTANPNGPLIYFGSFHADSTTGAYFSNGSEGFVNPQFLDIGTSHVHRAYTLVARPAGNVKDNKVIGYLPTGIDTTDSSDSAGDSSDVPRENLPTLQFSGTWTGNRAVTYKFILDGSTWGNVVLRWEEDGKTDVNWSVPVPAPNVWVSLDNGLRVRVVLPEATHDYAYSGLSADERTWNLTFPDAGKGWCDHDVTAIATRTAATPEGASDSSDPVVETVSSITTATPTLKAIVHGTWKENANTVGLLLPGSAYAKTITDATPSVTIGGTTYAFVQAIGASSDESVEVIRGATVNETLHNLARIANTRFSSATVFANGDKLVVCDNTLTDPDTTYTGIDSEGVVVVGGTLPLVVAYDANYELYGGLKQNVTTYVDRAFGTLKIAFFAEGATASTNYVCHAGTRLKAAAYDYALDARYDYVMGLHQEVDYYFPPVPAQAAGLFVNGVEMENAGVYPAHPTYVVGHKTLHWLSSAIERLPWPNGVTGHDDPVDPSVDKSMVFYFIVGFQCASGPVTSLVPAPGSSVKVYTYGTQDEAYTGDLMIDLVPDISVSDAGIAGYKVAKQGLGGKLLAGPVVERIRAGNGILVTQSAGCPSGQGTVTIGLAEGGLRGTFNEVALENAKQEKIGLFPYVSLLGWGSSNNIPSAFTVMMRVPSNLDAASAYQLHLRLVMFGTVGYENESRLRAAGIQLEYNILPDYTDSQHLSLKNGLLVPNNPRTINVPFGHNVGNNYTYKAFDPFVATTDANMTKTADICVPFSDLPLPSASEFAGQSVTPTLKAGYLLAVRLSRTTMTDTVTYSDYTNQVGFLSLEWTLEET